MKALKNLIRLHQWQLDQSRLALALAAEELTAIQSAIDALDDEEVLERRSAAQSEAVLFAFASYAVRLKERRAALHEEQATAERAAEAAREVVAEAFQEVKKLEQALQAQIDRETAEAARREQITLDEIAATGHQRRQSGG